jgi:hypothetical protein
VHRWIEGGQELRNAADLTSQRLGELLGTHVPADHTDRTRQRFAPEAP